MPDQYITVEAARQNNLKNVTVKIPLHKLTVVTGVSGSGKSSLAFDTIYSEGQRRYVETFSAYTRQFLDRMDKPQVGRIDGIPPAIAIDQTNPVRTSRSTVGTMTELNDHLKLLFARCARLYCRNCGRPVDRDTPQSALRAVEAESDGERPIVVTFGVAIPKKSSVESMKAVLASQGYQRFQSESEERIEVVQDRVILSGETRLRVLESIETAFHYGKGRITIHLLGDDRRTVVGSLRFSEGLHCAHCDIAYREPAPNTFSFNSPIGACEECRGFGRVISIDYDLVIPDDTKTLAEGAIKTWQSKSYHECQDDLMSHAARRRVPTDVPWKDLSESDRRWVIEGEGSWDDGKWYGTSRFFDWLESRSYKMHIRVLLSRYRAYKECPSCGGARLKPDSLLWRVRSRHRPQSGPEDPRGLNIREIMLLPIDECLQFFEALEPPAGVEEAAELVLEEVRTRLRYLVEVGLGYLTLDRQSRTLSGGEVQRINLTTALGTSLVNTLFVLDEPSIGLHSRDIGRLIGVLERLRDAGNTLLVVEHDPEMIAAADYLIDMGPGPGESGGEVVFAGEPALMYEKGRSLTAQYLRGERKVSRPAVGGDETAGVGANGSAIRILGAAQHNLKAIDVEIPLHRFVCVTGVSGSGKSTLIEDILYNGIRRAKHRPSDPPGIHRDILGHEAVDDVILVDQSPIGKTTRSNPASYVGAFDAIRKIFTTDPLARERGYTIGTFSFNSGQGRCPTCGGNGFEHIEMQFLSDVYIRCPDCDGKRYRNDVLEVKIGRPGAQGEVSPLSIAEVLAMTVTEACEFFAQAPEVLRGLAPLRDVGLDYLTLGQPVPTLSGGEAQRLKLAGYLAQSGAGKISAGNGGGGHILFLLDEPTTGLHYNDIAVLLRALRRLIAAGHSLLVIEHNLDVIAASDWLIDLGPEGGAEGGSLVAVGTPAEIRKQRHGYTGEALRRYLDGASKAPRPAGRLPVGTGRPNGGRRNGKTVRNGGASSIAVRNAREHNLKGVDITVPRDRFTVITGVSGSGKSTVAFDILFAEGQRRYLESLNAYARQFVQPASRADVDSVTGLPPTVAIEQRTSRGGRKSTVATVTEIYHFLRLLFVKLGTQYCPDCRIPIEPQTADSITARILKEYGGRTITLLAPLVTARKGYYTDLARWAAGKGFEQLRVDGLPTPTAKWPRLDRYKEHTIEAPVSELQVSARRSRELRKAIGSAVELGKGVVRVLDNDSKDANAEVFSTIRACSSCGRSFDELDPRLFSYNTKHGWCSRCYGTGLLLKGFDEEQTGEEIWWNDWYEGKELPCPQCGGTRLRPEALAVFFRGKNIAELTALSVEQAEKFFAGLRMKGREAEIARDLLAELGSRLAFLREVGLPYLTLDRSAPSLSGGEAQRIRLAAQLGSNLRGVCYILDEPTIGLHARDNDMLLDTLDTLRGKGNTVVVVEHDEETIRHAEHIIDLGPGGGIGGGRVVASGTLAALMRNRNSLTGRLLKTPLSHPMVERREVNPGSPDGRRLIIRGASLHNLKAPEVVIPLEALVCVTGVSGSGKSSLIRETLHASLRQLLAGSSRGRGRSGRPRGRSAADLRRLLTGCEGIDGWEQVERVLEVDQTPIGKTPRSCPATYVGVWDHIRRLYAETPDARMRGYSPSRFSFNVRGGRCPECEGQGVRKIEMSFLPDVSVRCEACDGRRFDEETLSVLFKERSIADILAMSVDEAVEFFSFHPQVHHALSLLSDVGLGYLSLGQQSPSLSGGEAQRIKLVTELSKAKPSAPRTLYVLDEPTIGLHIADVEKLVRVLHRLVDAGNTVVLIEHNLDVIAESDWIIDLGPEGGEAGGRIVAEGSPETVAGRPDGAPASHTAKYLAEFLATRTRPG